MRRIVAIVALILLPATLPAQRAADARAGVPPLVAPARDTTAADSVAPHRSRVVHAVGGGIVGALAGGLLGAIVAQEQTHHGNELAGLNVPFFAAIGLVGGVVVGALLPVR